MVLKHLSFEPQMNYGVFLVGWLFLVENPLIALNILLSPSMLINSNLLFVLLCLCNSCLLNCIRIMNSIKKTSKLFYNISRPRAIYHLCMYFMNGGGRNISISGT